MKRLLGAALAAVTLSWATSALAVGLGHFTTTSQFEWRQSAAKTGGAVTGSGNALFQYYGSAPNIPRSLYDTPLAATFVITATAPDGSVASCCGDGQFQQFVTFDFAFIYAGAEPLMIGDDAFSTGANLLSGTGLRGTLSNDASGGFLPDFTRSGFYSSDLIDLDGLQAYSVNLNFLQVSPAFTALRDESIGNFDGYGGRGVFFASVPEPQTWAVMILGFGLCGAALRRTRRAAIHPAH